MTREDWERSDAHAVSVFLNGDAITEPDSCGRPVVDASFLLLLNSFWEPIVFRLPGRSYGERWTTRIDTSDPRGQSDETEHKADSEIAVGAHSLLLLSRAPLTTSSAARHGRPNGGAR
jgi:glycogen operon protein